MGLSDKNRFLYSFMMGCHRKRIDDLPEHALEGIVSVIANNNADLNKFYSFGLSSKLFYKPTVHVLDQNNIYFPMDMSKYQTNKMMMKYMSLYDDAAKEKIGIRLLTKKGSNQVTHNGCKCCGDGSVGDGRIGEWLDDCKGLKKLFLDKIDVTFPVIDLSMKRLFFQNHQTLRVIRFQNELKNPVAISNDLWKRCICSCKQLKELEIIWNLNKWIDHDQATIFKYSMFDIVDNHPGLEILRIQVPEILKDEFGEDLKPLRESGELPDFKVNLLFIDIKARFFYEKTMFSLYYKQLLKTREECKTRKLFTLNGEPMYRTDD